MTRTTQSVKVVGSLSAKNSSLLTPEALNFVADLQAKFNPIREKLLERRDEIQRQIDAGTLPDFPRQTSEVRTSKWTVAKAPADLQDRRVEITGPVERKMMINAFNSGANVFMADFEDSLSPTWTNVVDGQLNLIDAVRKELSFVSPEGKSYKLNDKIATLIVRPRGWHLQEDHVLVEDKPISASLFDFGLYFYHNAKELISRGSGPYFYLPKMESHLEARLWNDVFNFAQDTLGIPRGTVRATVLIETIPAAFEMDEILYELREHASGLNAGRWDYLFSAIKKLNKHFVLPDRAQLTMDVPFMRSYCQLIVKTCHKRGAHAMGGMAAFIPSRKDAKINEVAIARVREDKQREAGDGFDGTWVAHPDLVAIAKDEFDRVLKDAPNQKTKMREDVQVSASDLLNFKIDGGKITRAGLESNIDVGLQYIESWLRGQGAAAIHNLMEDTATAEICRAQIWQWIHNHAVTDDGSKIDEALYLSLKEKQVALLESQGATCIKDASKILDTLVLQPEFVSFLTIPAYSYLNHHHEVS